MDDYQAGSVAMSDWQGQKTESVLTVRNRSYLIKSMFGSVATDV